MDHSITLPNDGTNPFLQALQYVAPVAAERSTASAIGATQASSRPDGESTTNGEAAVQSEAMTRYGSDSGRHI